MHEPSSGAPIVINISTIGYCSPTYSSQYRVGKSCLIHRFMNRIQYSEDHLSVISNSDYYGSVISGNQWIYWGSKIFQHDSKKYRLRIIEQCDFIDDHLFTPYGNESYVDRCFARIIHVETPRMAYICKDQVGNEWKYSHEILEPCDFKVNVFVIVMDITLTGEAAMSQRKFLNRAVFEMRKRKTPFVIVSTKHDSEVSSENKEFVKNLLHKGSRSLRKLRFCRVETSARFDVNVQQAFVSAALLCAPGSNDINCKYIPYSLPVSTHARQSLGDLKVHLRRSCRPDTIVSIYADGNSSPFDLENNRPSRTFDRINLAENKTYDLPVESKTLHHGLKCCEYLHVNASSFESSVRSSIFGNIIGPQLTNSHICYETITPTSNLPRQLVTPGRLHVAHIIHQPYSPRPTSVEELDDVVGFPSILTEIDSGNSHPQPLLMLFLSGPGASKLKTALQRHCSRDRFYLANGQCFRVWLFDDVDPAAVQISPSKWQPHRALRPSPFAPSAFTTPAQNSSSVSTASKMNASGDSSSTSKIAASSPDGSKRQLKLSLWVVDGVAVLDSEGRSRKSPPKHVDAVMFRVASSKGLKQRDEEYYDEVGGDIKVELNRALHLARLFQVPLFCLPENAPTKLLASLFFFAENAGLFQGLLKRDTHSEIPCLLPEAHSTISIALLMHFCSTDVASDGLAISTTTIEARDDNCVRFGQRDRASPHPLLSQRGAGQNRVISVFQNLPRVAIGLDFSSSFTKDDDEEALLGLPPLVAFVTNNQALELFSKLSPSVATTRFALLHFPTGQWPQFCAEITSQLETLLTVMNASLRPLDDRSVVLMLVAISMTDSTRPRQLINGLAAQRGCRIWHLRESGSCLERGDWDSSQVLSLNGSAPLFQPSLAFLHMQSESDRGFALYHQVLMGDMSAWYLSYSPDFPNNPTSSSFGDGDGSRSIKCVTLQGPLLSHQHHCHSLQRLEALDEISLPHNFHSPNGQRRVCVLLEHHRDKRELYFPRLSYRGHANGKQRVFLSFQQLSPQAPGSSASAPCCSSAMAGITDEDYVDAGFHLHTVTSLSGYGPVTERTSATLRGAEEEGEEEEEEVAVVSENYAEFNDLLSAASDACAPLQTNGTDLLLSSRERPQAPLKHLSQSPSFPGVPGGSLSVSGSASIASMTVSSLLTSPTSSSPERQNRGTGFLFRPCSDTLTTRLAAHTVDAPSAFTPIPINAALECPVSNRMPHDDTYEPVYEEPMQLQCRSPKCLSPSIAQSEWQNVYPSSTSWIPAPGGCFIPLPPPPLLSPQAEYPESMETTPAPMPFSSSLSPFCEHSREAQSQYSHVRRSTLQPVDSRRKSSELLSFYSNQDRCNDSWARTASPPPLNALRETPKSIQKPPKDPIETRKNERKTNKDSPPTSTQCPNGSTSSTTSEKTGTNKIFGSLKSAFKRHGSLFRSYSRKHQASKH